MGRLIRRFIRTTRLKAINTGIVTHLGVAGGGYAVDAIGIIKAGISMTGWWTPLYTSAEVEAGVTVTGDIASIFCEVKANGTIADAWALWIANNGTQVPKGAIRIAGNFNYAFDFAQTSNCVSTTGDITGGGAAGSIKIEVAGLVRYIQLYAPT